MKFEILKGQTLTDVSVIKDEWGSKTEIIFTTKDGTKYRSFNIEEGTGNDCSIIVEDICGNLKDLIGSKLLQAEKVTNKENPKGSEENFLWTFYRLATKKGFVTIKWYGNSNGYYSEDVSFEKMES